MVEDTETGVHMEPAQKEYLDHYLVHREDCGEVHDGDRVQVMFFHTQRSEVHDGDHVQVMFLHTQRGEVHDEDHA